MEEKIQLLLAWIRTHTPDRHQVLIPVSGGSDSALCFWLYATALPGRVIGMYFGDAMRARSWFESLAPVRMSAQPDTHGSDEVSRWAVLLDTALAENLVLIGTRNRTEQVLGTYSTASRVAYHQPLVGIWKSDVLSLGTHIGVPEEVLASSRAADPVCGRPEELAKIPFEAVDAFAMDKLGLPTAPPTLNAAQRLYLEELYGRNHFKQEIPLFGPSI